MARSRLRLERSVAVGELRREVSRALKVGDGVWVRRLEAVRMLSSGISSEGVAGSVGVSVRTLERWINLWNGGGFEAIKHRKASGRPLRLGGGVWKRLLGDLEGSPRKFGYDYDLWSTKLIMVHISTRYGVKYEYKYMFRLLRKRGALSFVSLAPRTRGEVKLRSSSTGRGPSHRSQGKSRS